MEKHFDPASFGKRLLDLLASKGIKQTELAGQIGMKPSNLSHYVKGRVHPHCNSLILLSHALDVSLDYLMTGRDVTVSALPPAQLDHLVERAHSNLHREAAKHSAMTSRIAQALMARIEEVAQENIKEALPGPEFLESNFMVEIERCSPQIWLTTKGLKDDGEADRIDVRFTGVVAENLSKGRTYRYILPEGQKGLASSFKNTLKKRGGSASTIDNNLNFQFVPHSPVIGYGLHEVDQVALMKMPNFPFNRVQDWIFPIESEYYGGYWLGHVMTPVPRAEFFTFMDKENVELALSTFHALWTSQAPPQSRRAPRRYKKSAPSAVREG